jgi:hypothetical protein
MEVTDTPRFEKGMNLTPKSASFHPRFVKSFFRVDVGYTGAKPWRKV